MPPRRSLQWHTEPSAWKDNSRLLGEGQADMPRLQGYVSAGIVYLRDIPWIDLVEGVCVAARREARTDDVLQAAAALGLGGAPNLKVYLDAWGRQSDKVQAAIEWRRCTPNEMCEVSRPGAWLADAVFTALCVEMGKLRWNAKYIAAGNDAYADLAADLGIVGEQNNSNNNLGNVLEFLTWVALEERRVGWIVAVGTLVAQAYVPPAAARR